MATMVETYEIEDVKSETIECSDEALRLIEELGLDGQRELIANKEDPGKKERIPYRKMTKLEFNVFRTLCPKAVELKKYRDEPIPVRVLQIAAHANSIAFFDVIQVWSKESADIEDPVLVGKKTEGHTTSYYLLARWGEMLEEMPAMIRIATELARKNATAWVEKTRAKVDQMAALIGSISIESAHEYGDWMPQCHLVPAA